MSSDVFQFNQSGIDFEAQFIDENGDPLDITGNSSVDMEFRKPDNAKVTELAITIVNALTGEVKYTESTTSKANILGAWEYRPRAHFVATPDLPGRWVQFVVED